MSGLETWALRAGRDGRATQLSARSARRRQVWAVRAEEVEGGQRFEILRDGSRVSFDELFTLLETDPEFGAWYTAVLSKAEFESFFWEHPPISTSNCQAAAEFVLVNGPALAQLRPDPDSFRSQFQRDRNQDVLTFPNLGGDAVLVVPRPLGPPAAYAHLAAFVRQAPRPQVQCLWQQVGRALRDNVTTQPRWLSTAGMGVPWVHIRIDSYPKYYRFSPYKAAA